MKRSLGREALTWVEVEMGEARADGVVWYEDSGKQGDHQTQKSPRTLPPRQPLSHTDWQGECEVGAVPKTWERVCPLGPVALRLGEKR